MKTFYTLTGPSASGKTTVERRVCEELNKKRVISYTSRNPRPNEEEGKSYFFTTKDAIKEMKNNGDLAEFAEYNDNYYASSKEEIDNSDIMVVEPMGLSEIRKYLKSIDRPHCAIYLNCEEEEAINRMKDRGDDDYAIYKRVVLDRERFHNTIVNPLTNYDIIITTDGFTIDEVVDIVSKIMNR